MADDPDPSGGGSNPPPGGGGSNSPPGGSSGSSTGPSIDSLTDAINQLAKTGQPDVKLSTATRDQYLKIITDFRSLIEWERQKMPSISTIGNVGSLNSADQTKKNLQLDMTGASGIEQTTDKYIKYLDAFENAVKKAADRLIQSG
jgi:hypothetical protein